MNYCPSNLLSGSPFPVSKYSLYRQCDAGRGWVMLSFVGDHILQEFNTLYLTRFRTYKIALPPQRKPSRRGSLTDKHLPQSPFILEPTPSHPFSVRRVTDTRPAFFEATPIQRMGTAGGRPVVIQLWLRRGMALVGSQCWNF